MAAIRSRTEAASSKRSASAAAAHPDAEFIDQRPFPSFEKGDAIPHEFPIGLAFDPADAGGRAAADLVFEAGTAADLQLLIPATPERKDRLEEAEGFPGGGAGGIGAEIAGAVRLRTAHQLEPRERLCRIDADVEIGLVVPEIDVVPGPVLLDQVVLKDQRLLLRPRDDELHITDPGNEERNHRPAVGPGEVGPDARLQIPRLSHVEDLPRTVLHEIDAGAPGGVSDLCLQLGAHRLRAVILDVCIAAGKATRLAFSRVHSLPAHFLSAAASFFWSASPSEPKEPGALPTYFWKSSSSSAFSSSSSPSERKRDAFGIPVDLFDLYHDALPFRQHLGGVGNPFSPTQFGDMDQAVHAGDQGHEGAEFREAGHRAGEGRPFGKFSSRCAPTDRGASTGGSARSGPSPSPASE